MSNTEKAILVGALTALGGAVAAYLSGGTALAIIGALGLGAAEAGMQMSAEGMGKAIAA